MWTPDPQLFKENTRMAGIISGSQLGVSALLVPCGVLMGQDHQSLTDREYQRGYPMTGKQRDSQSVSEECTGIRLIGNWAEPGSFTLAIPWASPSALAQRVKQLKHRG